MIDTGLPPPSALGLPSKFQQWREDQVQALSLIFDAPTRFVGLNMPTGNGKSLVYAAAMHLSPGYNVALTATKGLQDQIGEDFSQSLGLLDLRGQANYPCLALMPGGEFDYFNHPQKTSTTDPPTCDEGPCHGGIPCGLREHGCLYYDQIRRAQQGRPLITNYALWLAQRRYSQGLGTPSLLCLDEAHDAHNELSGALQIQLDKYLLQQHGLTQPPEGDVEKTRDWAGYWLPRVKVRLDNWAIKHTGDLKVRRQLRRLEGLLQSIVELVTPHDWIEDHTPKTFVYDVVDPRAYAERYLFQGAKKVVLLSAFLSPKLFDLLGISKSDMTFWECPSRFAVARRPVYFIPTCKVDHKMKPEHWNVLCSRIDQIIAPRQNVKGILHTVSYKRRDTLLARSEYNSIMVTHSQKPGDVARVVRAFKLQPGGGVLISPSLTTGWDFPDAYCRYQILPKLPIPDTRSLLIKARVDRDPDYLMYLTALTLIQMVGRGMRSPTDWCETFLLDDNWRWFQRYRQFLSKWFLEAVRQVPLLPKPLHF